MKIAELCALSAPCLLVLQGPAPAISGDLAHNIFFLQAFLTFGVFSAILE